MNLISICKAIVWIANKTKYPQQFQFAIIVILFQRRSRQSLKETFKLWFDAFGQKRKVVSSIQVAESSAFGVERWSLTAQPAAYNVIVLEKMRLWDLHTDEQRERDDDVGLRANVFLRKQTYVKYTLFSNFQLSRSLVHLVWHKFSSTLAWSKEKVYFVSLSRSNREHLNKF